MNKCFIFIFVLVLLVGGFSNIFVIVVLFNLIVWVIGFGGGWVVVLVVFFLMINVIGVIMKKKFKFCIIMEVNVGLIFYFKFFENLIIRYFLI